MKEILGIIVVLAISGASAVFLKEFVNVDPHGAPIEASVNCPVCAKTCEPQLDFTTGKFNKTWRCPACDKYFKQ